MNNGASWFRYGVIPYYSLLTAIEINPQDTSNIFVGGVFFIYRTTDNGNTWQASYIGDEIVGDIEIDKNQPFYVYATTKKYLYRSTNNGQNWSITDSLKGYNSLKIHPYASETLYIATDSGVFKSNNYGQYLYPLTNGLPDRPFSRVGIDGYFPWLIYAGLESTSGPPALYRSVSGGLSWVPTSYPEPSVGQIKGIKNLLLYLLVCSGDSKVFYSLSAGNSFYNISPNLPDNFSPAIDLSLAMHTAYLGNLSGVYCYTDTTPPLISIFAPDSFSPDGDGVNDRIRFNLSASDTHGIYYWKLSILHDTITCLEIEGYGQPDSILWDGFDSLGILQKNGLYTARFYCVDAFFNYDSTGTSFYLVKRPMVSGVNYATALTQGRKIAVDNLGRIHLVYTTFSPTEVFYTNSINGVIWQEPLDLSNTRNSPSLNPTIVIDNDNRVYVFWEEEIDGQTEIVYRRYSGVSWDTIIRLTNTPEPSVNPSVVVTANNDLHLVYQEMQTDEIYYRRYNFLNGNWT